ncbi:RNA polymerase sigma factor [Devosia lacusdianchii]|uniref:RNA polymerase sigma factor n=1 Tax=Devosia lacusdianchii TaxID=2917991 RepID=UPI001F056EF6|nr:DUF6596 domain-containing protein [Devosia sp. JXJ CY 41]
MKSLAEGQFGPRFFQHGYGRLVALLARRLGRQNLARIEDAVQTALLRALETWTRSSPPASPEAWLYRVAVNIYLEEVRREARHQTILQSDMAAAEEDFIESDLAMVQMLVVCCDGQLSTKTSVALALKLLCGFGVPEIALRLFETESSIYKILQRGRAVLGRRSKSVLEVGDRQLQTRMPALCTVLYTLYCEGYNSLAGEVAVRAELCGEAIRLATLVAATARVPSPMLFALLALMHFGAARLPGRIGASGELLLLDEQDRSVWDGSHIAVGFAWLAKSAEGDTFSRYHAEAAVAAEHCRAVSRADMNWHKVVQSYELLFAFDPSPLHQLDWVVAVGELHGPLAAIEAFHGLELPVRVRRSYVYLAVASTLERRIGNLTAAAEISQRAMAAAPTASMRRLIGRALSGPEPDGRHYE